MTGKRLLYLLLSIAISVVLMAFLVRGLDWELMGDSIRAIRLPYVALFLLTYALSVLVRAFRYLLFIGPGRIRFVPVLLVTIVRNMLVDFLPARLGSLSYVILLKKKYNLAYEIGTSSLGLAIFFDAAAIFPLIFLATLFIKPVQHMLAVNRVHYLGLVLLINLLFFACMIFLDKLVILGRVILNRIFTLLRLDNWKLSHRLHAFLDKLFNEIKDSKARGIYLPLFLLSILLRVLKYGGLYFLLLSVLHASAPRGEQFGFFSVFLGIAITEMSGFLPIKGFMGIGTWHAAFTYVFAYLHILPAGTGKIAGILLHGITQIVEYTAGIITLIAVMVRKKKDRPQADESAPPDTSHI